MILRPADHSMRRRMTRLFRASYIHSVTFDSFPRHAAMSYKDEMFPERLSKPQGLSSSGVHDRCRSLNAGCKDDRHGMAFPGTRSPSLWLLVLPLRP